MVILISEVKTMRLFRAIGAVFDSLINPEEYADLGKAGERLTFRELKGKFPVNQIFRNLYIKQKNGKYTEIDLATADNGILIIYESKNYSGWIFGDDTADYWTQTFQNGKKQKFYSPVRQNNTHIEALREYLKDYPLEYHSVIVFSERCKLKNVTCSKPNTHVIRRDKVKNIVSTINKNASSTISKEQFDEVLALLSKVQRPDDDIKNQHLEDVKETLTTCPKCKSELIEKTVKTTGKQFWGCSKFPKCKYTR
jgi:ssDNA-binding Zn-finger/Zn-ribbon topoisomerase 1